MSNTVNENTSALSLVLIPGSLCNEKLFTSQVEFFSKQRQVIVADISQSNSIEGMARDILNATPKKFALAGLSMGGIIAFEILRQAPERVDRLALIDTSFGAEPDEKKSIRLQHVDDAKQQGLDFVVELIKNTYFPLYVAASRQDSQALKNIVTIMAKESGLDGFVNHWQAIMTRPDSTQSLANIECPTLVLCGEEDALCKPKLHEHMAATIPNSHLAILEDCGHLSTIEKPREVNEALDTWLQYSDST